MKLIFLKILLMFPFIVLPQKIQQVAEIGDFYQASSFSINAAGFIYVTDAGANEIIKLDTLGNELISIGGYGWSESAFDEPVDIFATTLNLYVADKNNHRIQFFDKDLNYLSEFGINDIDNPDYAFAYPTSCATSNQGDFYILDSDNLRVLKYDLNGNFLIEIGNIEAGDFSLNSPKKFAISPNGKIFIIENNEVKVFDQFGAGITRIKPGFVPENINITFNFLTITNNKNIVYSNLLNQRIEFIKHSNKDLVAEEIIEGLIFNRKLYILTEHSIYIYKL